ncbi:MAG: ATP-binding protein [Marinoscillum sp.]
MSSALERIDCKELIESVKEDLQSLIDSNEAEIIIEELPHTISGYKLKLRQLFQNLLSNAVKFRKLDVAPKITISCSLKSIYYEFLVSDNGIGIDRSQFDKIFLVFRRATNSGHEGQGIGLANCKKNC